METDIKDHIIELIEKKCEGKSQVDIDLCVDEVIEHLEFYKMGEVIGA
jgi:hypothetical protein